MTTSIFKKDGQLTEAHKEVVSLIAKNGKVYPRTWVGSGRRKTLRDISHRVIEVAKHYNYKIEMGNDAPRGGKEGDYIKFSSRAQKSLSSKF